jgi:uncharacterized protein with predicted RNA binding PUA domain
LFRLRAVRQLASFQFSVDGELLFPEGCEVEVSPTTGKVRRVQHGGRVIATVRPSDGFLSLTFEGAQRLSELLNGRRMHVVVDEAGVRRVLEGFDVSPANIVEADPGIIPGMEVLVYGVDGKLLPSEKPSSQVLRCWSWRGVRLLKSGTKLHQTFKQASESYGWVEEA